MAAIVSPWAKPGAWALDSEENESDLLQQQPPQPAAAVPAADFPSLAAAAATKPAKKKKGQTLSLAEFTTGSAPVPYSRPTRVAHEEPLVLPRGPRERSAEELDGSRLGGGFRSYGTGRYGDDSSRRGGGGGFDESGRREPPPPSRADEIDDWGAGKKPMSIGGGFDRRGDRGDRSERGEGFFTSQSKADESDNWGSNKSSEPRRFGNGGGGSDFPRERRGFRAGYEGLSNGPGADSDRWGRKREDDVLSNGSGGGGADSDRWARKREDDVLSNGSGGGAGSDRWGRRREEEVSSGISSSRPKLVLQPRTLPVTEVVVRPMTPPVSDVTPVTVTVKPRGANPFGDARPREEVLKEKGQDWKEIDEKLESVRIKETDRGEKGEGAFGQRSFGSSRASLPEEKTERSWRKNNSDPVEEAAAPSSEEKDETAEEEATPTEA